jgi:hypothetical protein
VRFHVHGPWPSLAAIPVFGLLYLVPALISIPFWWRYVWLGGLVLAISLLALTMVELARWRRWRLLVLKMVAVAAFFASCAGDGVRQRRVAVDFACSQVSPIAAQCRAMGKCPRVPQGWREVSWGDAVWPGDLPGTVMTLAYARTSSGFAIYGTDIDWNVHVEASVDGLPSPDGGCRR